MSAPGYRPAYGDAGTGDAALIRGLRLPRHEAQLTQVIGQVAMADRGFAAEFARVLLQAAAKNPRHSSEAAHLLDVPDELDCIAEHHLPGRDRDEPGLGFVDLAFEGEPDFTLFVENKLHSGYGHDQVKRYLDALDQLPEHRRSGLVAVTRNYPSYGEDEAVGRKGWLGSVRWRALLPGLRKLKPVNQHVTRQWWVLLDVLEAQGDLGVTEVKTDLVKAWAHYIEGREHLADILGGLREHALDVLSRELKGKHGGAGKELVSEWRKGEREVVAVIRDQRSVWIGFSVPAGAPEPSLVIQFDNSFNTPLFTVQAEPWRAHERLESDRQFRQAARRLEAEGFKPDSRRHRWWAKPHTADTWLEQPDVEETLAGFIEQDVRTIVDSRLLKGEFEAANQRGGRRVRRKRR